MARKGQSTFWANSMVTERTKYTIWFKDCSGKHFLQVGGKNANLGEMFQLGLRVPPGFAVTTDAFDTFLDRGRVRNEIARALSQITPQNIKVLEEVGARVRDLIGSAPIPKEIVEEIKEAYGKLCELCRVSDVPVAVRSSATCEDLATASFAGQHESYLWVRNEEEVIRHILKCWASLFTDRAIVYRSQVGWPQDKVTISVGIQKMVNAKCAGVMFTIHPVLQDLERMVIEGNWGLGESVVGGKVNVDTYVVAKKDLKVIEMRLGEKRMQVVAKGGRTLEEELPAEKQNVYVLNNEEVIEIAKVGKILESCFNQPQDIEWAIDADIPFPENIFLLQVRPVVGVEVQKPKTTEEQAIDELIKHFF
jgi:pyruvate,water dikinase